MMKKRIAAMALIAALARHRQYAPMEPTARVQAR